MAESREFLNDVSDEVWEAIQVLTKDLIRKEKIPPEKFECAVLKNDDGSVIFCLVADNKNIVMLLSTDNLRTISAELKGYFSSGVEGK